MAFVSLWSRCTEWPTRSVGLGFRVLSGSDKGSLPADEFRVQGRALGV